MRKLSFFFFTAILLFTCSCTCTSDWEVPSSRETTINYLEEYVGLENPKLIFGKYILIACVIDTRYSTEGDFDPDNPTGYRTGQIIDVVVIDNVACYDGGYEGWCEGEIIEGIFSYGGDTGIIGKPEAGDIVGWRLGNYASIWEKIDLAELCESVPYLE